VRLRYVSYPSQPPKPLTETLAALLSAHAVSLPCLLVILFSVCACVLFSKEEERSGPALRLSTRGSTYSAFKGRRNAFLIPFVINSLPRPSPSRRPPSLARSQVTRPPFRQLTTFFSLTTSRWVRLRIRFGLGKILIARCRVSIRAYLLTIFIWMSSETETEKWV
jgi:hypothetical protein